jgi:hypothetical protein
MAEIAGWKSGLARRLSIISKRQKQDSVRLASFTSEKFQASMYSKPPSELYRELSRIFLRRRFDSIAARLVNERQKLYSVQSTLASDLACATGRSPDCSLQLRHLMVGQVSDVKACR